MVGFSQHRLLIPCFFSLTFTIPQPKIWTFPTNQPNTLYACRVSYSFLPSRWTMRAFQGPLILELEELHGYSISNQPTQPNQPIFHGYPQLSYNLAMNNKDWSRVAGERNTRMVDWKCIIFEELGVVPKIWSVASDSRGWLWVLWIDRWKPIQRGGNRCNVVKAPHKKELHGIAGDVSWIIGFRGTFFGEKKIAVFWRGECPEGDHHRTQALQNLLSTNNACLDLISSYIRGDDATQEFKA